MDYIVPTWLILMVVSALAIGVIILGVVILFLLQSWYRKRSNHRN